MVGVLTFEPEQVHERLKFRSSVCTSDSRPQWFQDMCQAGDFFVADDQWTFASTFGPAEWPRPWPNFRGSNWVCAMVDLACLPLNNGRNKIMLNNRLWEVL